MVEHIAYNFAQEENGDGPEYIAHIAYNLATGDTGDSPE
jgi:hypothetical protein